MLIQDAKIFKALGDPLRLKIVNRLFEDGVHTVGNLTKNLGVSRQGARKQLQVLENAKILRLKPEGREIKVVIDMAALSKAREFISGLEKEWDNRLSRLKDFVEKN